MVQREGKCASLMRCVLEFPLVGLMAFPLWVASVCFFFLFNVVATWLVSAVLWTAVSGARPRDFVKLPGNRSLYKSAGFQCVNTRRKPHED